MSRHFVVPRRLQAIGLLLTGAMLCLLLTATVVKADYGSSVMTIVNLAKPNAASIVYAKPGGLSSGLCNDWANACELRYVLTNTVAGQEIWVAKGIYTPTSTLDRHATFQLIGDVAMYGGFAMTETSRNQRNPWDNVTILSGDLLDDDVSTFDNNGENSYHVVTGASDATLDGFTVRGGNADAPGSCPGVASCAGGMYNNGSNNLTLSNLVISGNRAFFGAGMVNIGSSLILTDVIISDNLADFPGGGMLNENSSLVLNNVTLNGNSAGGGGGMQNNSSNLTLINVTLSGNTAPLGSGGGMVNNASSLTLTNVTLNMNAASMGGGMYNANSSNPMVRNSIFWGNIGGEIANNNSIPAVSYSVIQGGYVGGINIITADPKLSALGDYGGNTPTIPLLPGSSAIGATSTNCPATDQRGVPRNVPCDIGAFELIKYHVFMPLLLH